MPRITATVGSGGENAPVDVLAVQRLLNRHDLSPLLPVRESGEVDPLTVDAIKHFQTRYLGMQSPDGRVDRKRCVNPVLP